MDTIRFVTYRHICEYPYQIFHDSNKIYVYVPNSCPIPKYLLEFESFVRYPEEKEWSKYYLLGYQVVQIYVTEEKICELLSDSW